MNITNLIVAALRVLRILLFLVGITIPLVGFYFNWQGGGKLESKGKRIALPAIGVTPLEWGRYVLKYRALFNDEFGFRKGLIRLHAITRFKLFGIASNDKVLLGKQGWFYMGKYFDSIEYARHQRPFSEHELQSWKHILERRRDALRKRGIHYIFAVAPNKESIYPEYLPGWYTRVTRQSRLDQLLEYMRDHSDVKIIDLRTPLLAAKNSTPLFYKTDSHWNAYGACAGCESIITAVREIFPNVPVHSIDQFVVSRKRNAYHGDLLHLSGLGDFIAEDDILVNPSVPRRAVSAQLAHHDYSGKLPCFATECDAPNLPRVVVFRDSFFMALQPILSEYFRRAVYIWQNDFDERVIQREPCDIVIQEIVERTLIWPPAMDTFGEG